MNNFDINKLNDSIVMLIGKRGSGKTVLVKHILDSISISKIAIMTSQHNICDVEYFYKNYYPQILVFNIDTLENFINTSPIGSCLILENSCLFVNNCFNKDLDRIINIFHLAKIRKITIIITTQYPYNMSHEFKNMIDYFFLFYDDLANNNKKLYNIFNPIFGSYESFIKLFQEYTCKDRHRSMIIDHDTNEIFKYQTPETEWWGWII